MTPLEALWAATTQAEADEARTNAWLSVALPMTVGTITITSCEVRLPIVEFHGEGGTLDWPLRLIGAPLGVPDPDGLEVNPDGSTWRTDPTAVLTGIVEQYA